MSLRLNGSTSGYTELDAGAVAGNNVIKMPASNGAAYQVLRNGATPGTLELADKIVSETAKAYNWNGLTNNTSIDFTGIPSWVKRVTVMFDGVSLSGTSNILIQLGTSSGITTSGYSSASATVTASPAVASSSSGFIIRQSLGSRASRGLVSICLIASNNWVASGSAFVETDAISTVSGSASLSSTLNRIRITTVNGTDTFDAGTINILYE